MKRPAYYLPCRRGCVHLAVAYYRYVYGRYPRHIGRGRWYLSSGVLHARGPVYIGPIPPQDVDAWPGAETLPRGVYVWDNAASDWRLTRDV